MDFFNEQVVFLSQASQSGGFDFRQFMPFLLIFLVIYFLIIRPQTKRQQLLDAKKRSIQKGDRFVTTGGLWGKVDHFKDERTIVAIIAPSVKVEIVKDMIYDVMVEVNKKGQRLDDKGAVQKNSSSKNAVKKSIVSSDANSSVGRTATVAKKSKSSATKSAGTRSKKKK